MLLQQTLDKLRKMKLNAMASGLEEKASRADHQDLPHTDFVGLLVDEEYNARENRRMAGRLRVAKFKEKGACIADLDYKSGRNLKKTLVLELAKNTWIQKHQNVVITGPSGVGKSYLAQALGHHACREGYSTLYLRYPKLQIAMLHAKADGTYGTYLTKLARTGLLILDDLGLSALSEPESRDLLEILEDRYGVRSTIITSQLPLSSWHEFFGGSRIADAICDRLLHNAYRIELTASDSIRKLMAASELKLTLEAAT